MMSLKSKQIILFIFSTMMGFLEAIVVVYIRRLFYPLGFAFPLASGVSSILVTECLREITTIVMLLSIAVLAGSSFLQGFSFFLYAFGVWDIFYYVALKVLLDWPESLLAWDVLFLIPVVWIGPVLAPLLCSVSMIGLAFILLHFEHKQSISGLAGLELILLVFGSLVILLSFILDFSVVFIQGLRESRNLAAVLTGYVPDKFNWVIFTIGEAIILTSAVLIVIRAKRRINA